MNCEIQRGNNPNPPAAGQAATIRCPSQANMEKAREVHAENWARIMSLGAQDRLEAYCGFIGWTATNLAAQRELKAFLDRRFPLPSGMSAAPSEFRSSDVSSAGPCRQG